MKTKILCAFYLIVLSCLPTYAQQKLSEKDDAFFEAQKPYYQAWLEAHNLSSVIRTDQVFTDTIANTLTIQLMLNYQTADSAIVAYDKLKEKFYNANSLPLEEALFYKATQLMELPSVQTFVEIRDKASCRKIKIALANDGIAINTSACKALGDEIKIKIPEHKGDVALVRNVNNIKRVDSQENFAIFQQSVLKKVKSAAEQHYAKKEGKFTFWGIQNGVLRFEVSDIQKEVLADGNLMFDKYEYIVFTVSCQQDREDTKVKFMIDAKSGASFPWKPRLSAFTPIDADKEGKALLQRYVYIFGAMLEDWITK
jgi:hypothetical protein